MKRIINLPPIRPNMGTGSRYMRELKAITKAMSKDMQSYVLDTYSKTNDPDILNGAIQLRIDKWENFIRGKSAIIANQFVNNIDSSTRMSLQKSFSKLPEMLEQRAKDLTVKLNVRGQNALISQRASVIENVELINSIPQQYQKELQFYVNEAASQGRNIKYLKEKIMSLGHSTESRATLIAIDQMNKVTSLINTARQRDLGITKNQWHHSSRPKQPRKSHEEADKKIYNINEGCLIDNEYIYPGQKIRCYCFSSPIIEFDDGE